MTEGSSATEARSWSTARAVALVVVLIAPGVVGSAAAGAAPARDVTADEAAAMVAEAVDDDDVLAEVRSIETVDGRPVDLVSATAGLEGDLDRADRLTGLAEEMRAARPGEPETGAPATGGSDRAADPVAARDAAAEVLDDRKYQPTDLPRPLAGPLGWLADRIRPLGDAWDSVVAFADRIPGGRYLLVLVVVGAACGAVVWLIGRRSRAAVVRSRSSTLVDLTLDPAHLEREADEAERDGDHATAVRRRYEAGLLRLVAAGRVDLTPATTAAGAAAQVGDVHMDEATATFEEVVYGGRTADASDSERSRRLWTDLVGTGVRR